MLLDIVDAIRTGVASDEAVDDSATYPFDPKGGELYAYPVRTSESSISTGGVMEQDFEVALAFCAASAAEFRAQRRKRTVSEAIEAKAQAYADWVRENHRTADWVAIRVVGFDFEGFRDFDARGFEMRIAGNRIVRSS